jgi:hypothetical protein
MMADSTSILAILFLAVRFEAMQAKLSQIRILAQNPYLRQLLNFFGLQLWTTGTNFGAQSRKRAGKSVSI